jgi:hypothetical protein
VEAPGGVMDDGTFHRFCHSMTDCTDFGNCLHWEVAL